LFVFICSFDLEFNVGTDVGTNVGTNVGTGVGYDVCTKVGTGVGTGVGSAVGSDVGSGVICKLNLYVNSFKSNSLELICIFCNKNIIKKNILNIIFNIIYFIFINHNLCKL